MEPFSEECQRRIEALEEELRQSVRMEGIGQVVGNAAHEINSALSLVIGYAELVLGQAADARQRDSLAAILDGGRRAGMMAGHLLQLARRLRWGIRSVDVNGMIGDLAALMRCSCERRNLMLLEDLQEGLPQIEVHAGQLQLMVLTLLQEALVRMVEGGNAGILQVRTSLDERGLAVEVESEITGPAEGGGRGDENYVGSSPELCAQIAGELGGELRVEEMEGGDCATLLLPIEEKA